MNSNDFIRKFGINNFYSIIEGLNDNLVVLYYGKKIPKYNISKRRKIVSFYTGTKTFNFDIIELYYMSNSDIIKTRKKEVEQCSRDLNDIK